ncbi:hypothetical protein LJC49_02335 [Ruminococcaceae bacterium OttesenSCG-928-I18]|nr:hypothetical protein [Ruminococcaceae bacterium OttesenSCG-928-I18]
MAKHKIRKLLVALATVLVFGVLVSCGPGEKDPKGWAQGIFDKSLQKLAEQGAVEYDPEEFLFTFEETEAGDFTPLLTSDALALYGDSPVTIGERVIYSLCKPDGEIVVFKNDGSDLNLPVYTPVQPDDIARLTDVDPARFANKLKECDTLIVYGGFESERSQDYYMGGMDRVKTTTLVFVIDAREKEILHIEVIGTDAPGNMTDVGYTTGHTLDEEAAQYVSALLNG